MALNKTVTATNGVSGEYWRVAEITYLPKKMVSFNVFLYLSQVARDGGCTPMDVLTYTVHGANIEGCAVTFCYNHLKTLPEFEGATNV